MIPPRFSTEQMREVLELLSASLGTGLKFRTDRMPDKGRFVYLARTPGAGYEMEETVDNVGIAVECRGGQNNLNDAEAMANEVDYLLSTMLTSGSVEFDDVVFYSVQRPSGGPQRLQGQDAEKRYGFSCNYIVKVSTQLGENYA